MIYNVLLPRLEFATYVDPVYFASVKVLCLDYPDHLVQKFIQKVCHIAIYYGIATPCIPHLIDDEIYPHAVKLIYIVACTYQANTIYKSVIYQICEYSIT